MAVGHADRAEAVLVTKRWLFNFNDKDKANFIVSKEKLQCGLKNYSTKITT